MKLRTWTRSGSMLLGSAVALAAVAGCAPEEAPAAQSTVTVYTSKSPASSTPATSPGKSTGKPCDCTAPVIAIDPGHNADTIEPYDPVTGVLMRDYPNGAEDGDTFAVSEAAKAQLEGDGYTVVLVKESPAESISYRDRLTRAEKAKADMGVSVHTYTDDHRVFPQRVGLFREGLDANGEQVRVTFEDEKLAAESQDMATKFAAARSKVEGRTVDVVDNSFDGRAPLWAGNIPMISLISTKVPWVYNEFGTAGGGGSAPIGDEGIALYTDSLVAGIKAAVPNTCAAKPSEPNKTSKHR